MDNYNVDYSYDRTTGSSSLAFSKLMRNVYSWMALALLITAITALGVARNPNIQFTIATNPMLLWGSVIAELGLVFWLSARIMKMSFMKAGILFGLYAILNGVTMSFLLIAYTKESVAATFFITAGTFAAMSAVGYFIKKDLSAMGRVVMMLLIGLIIATVVNLFMKSSGMAMLISYAGVIIFVLLTAYDTQKIKNMMQQSSQYGVNDETSKIALMGSLALYLDFINLFIYLLRIFGDRR